MEKSSVICTTFIIILIAGGLATLIAWLADQMKSPTFSVDQASINNYNFTKSNHLNATFDLTFRTHNRDSKYAIKYQVVVVSVYHNAYTLAYETVAPFVLPHGEENTFSAGPTSQNVLVSDNDVAEDMRSETKDGQLTLEVRVRAAVRFEVKGWKHRHYTLKIICKNVVINLTSGKSFQPTKCNVDRF